MKEQISLARARIRKAGQNFEVVVDPRAALDYKEGRILDIKEVLKDIHIYSDANKGLKVKSDDLKKAFGTDESLEVAKEIILKGDTPETAEIRSEKREKKKREIIQKIKRFGIDPRTKAPHTEQRIEAAFAEAKVRIDEHRSADDQVQDIIKKLQSILPIKLETKNIQVHIPAEHAQKCFSTIKQFGKITKDQWGNDGSWTAVIEVPGGLEADFYDALNKITQGNVQTKVI